MKIDELPGGQRLDVGEFSLQVYRRGKGPNLVYFHPGDGLDRSIGLLDSLAEDFTVVAPSPPGFDRSGPLANLMTVDDLSYVMLDLLEAQGIDDAVFVGASFGAWLACEIAVKTRRHVAKLVLVNPVGIKIGGPGDRDIKDIFYFTHRDVRGVLYADGKMDETDYGTWPQEDVDTVVRNRQSLAWFGWSPLLHNPQLRSRLHRIGVPTLVLRAGEDQVVSERYTRAFAEAIGGAVMDVVPGAGHYVHDELPGALSDRIKRFAGEPAAIGAGRVRGRVGSSIA